jgi:hypothetical protein
LFGRKEWRRMSVDGLITVVRGAAVTAAAFPPCRVTRRCTRARRGAPPLSHHLTLTGPTSPQSSHGVASAGPCAGGGGRPARQAGRGGAGPRRRGGVAATCICAVEERPCVRPRFFRSPFGPPSRNRQSSISSFFLGKTKFFFNFQVKTE